MNELALVAGPSRNKPPSGGLAPIHPDVSWTKEAFGLTAKEYEIVFYLAGGRSPQQIADHTNSSWHTVRTHMNSIYKKTKVNHVVGLMALLLAGPPK
jgi:DNA-binding CsgD family transcriptional regulator